MAHLWHRVQSEVGDEPSSLDLEWAAAPLLGDSAALGAGSALLLRRADAGLDSWLLVGPPDACVNGLPLLAGLRALCDRDEVRVGELRFFFATERLARVEPLPGAAQPIYCARCKDVIVPGADAVRCPDPACGLWHHQCNDTPCWTYAPTCALCPQPTDLGASYRWTPEDL
jgi:hypothetical protein